ncbi:hypothetical protein D3C72_2057600 [compost metagenome]
MTHGFGKKASGSDAPFGASKASAAAHTSCVRRRQVPSTTSGGDITTARSSSPARMAARKSVCMLTQTSMRTAGNPRANCESSGGRRSPMKLSGTPKRTTPEIGEG